MNDQKIKLSPFTILGDGLLLLCALEGLTASFLSLYGDPANVFLGTALDVCAAQTDRFLLMAGVFALTSLCAWSLPRFRWAAAGGLTALWGFSLFFNWESLIQGAGLTVHTITVIFSRWVSWGNVFHYDPELTPAREEAVVQLFLLLTLMGLALILGWAVARAKRWWIVVLLTLPPLLPGLLADLYPAWPGFMVLCACWCAMLLTDLCKWAAPDRRGKLTLTVLPAVGLLLAATTLAFPREGYTRPNWVLRLETELYSTVNRLSDSLQLDGPFQSTVTYVGAAEEADLAHAGPLRYSGRTVLRVTSDYDGRMYLRGSSLAVYEDGKWTAQPEGTWQKYLDSLDDPDRSAFPLIFPSLSSPHIGEYTVTVDNVGAVGACVYAPYFLISQDWEAAGMLPVEDSYLARLQGQWTHTMVSASLVPYSNGYMPPEASAYRDYVWTNYLSVPQALAEPLLELCWGNGISNVSYDGGSGPLETAWQVAALLDKRCEYVPETPAAPEGEDPVLYFLNESRRGYCMHYASAAALMLRSLGVPTRYVSGFTSESVPDQQVNVPDRAAHAWVEVWLDGCGWYPVEVTPAAAFTWYEQEPTNTVALPSESLPESEAPAPTPTPSQSPDASQPPASGPQTEDGDVPSDSGPALTVPVKLLKGLAIAAGMVLLLWLAQYLPKKYRALRLAGKEPNQTALYAYRCLRRMERWGGRVDPRAVELAQKAKFSQHLLTQEELAEMRGFVEAERDRRSFALSPVERLAFRCWWGRPKRKRLTGKDSLN